MIRHFAFYAIESAVIVAAVWFGVLLAANALRRVGVPIRVRWIATVWLWLAVWALDALLSEALGPEFTLHYYLGIWTFIGGALLWLVIVTRQGVAGIRGWLARRSLQS